MTNKRIEFSVINAQQNSVRSFQFVIENWLGIYFANVRTKAGGNFVGYEYLYGIYLFKLIEDNDRIYIVIQISIVVELCYVILYFLEQQEYIVTFIQKNAFSYVHNQNTPFNDASQYIQIADFRLMFVVLNFIFVPFKMFNLFSWVKNTAFFIKFANCIFRKLFYSFSFCINAIHLINLLKLVNLFILNIRTMHGVIRLTFMLIIIYFCWSLAIFIGLKSYNVNFDTLLKSSISFITYDPSSKYQSDRVKSSMSLKSLYFVYTSILTIMRQLMTLILTAVIVNTVQLAQDYEFDCREPFQKIVTEQVSEVCRKLDKFEKQTLSFIKGKQYQDNDKIIIWLQSNMDQYTSERQLYFAQKIKKSILKKSIKLIEFNTIQEVHEFLQYLFKLKPNLLYQSSHYFRILLDYSFNKNLRSPMCSPILDGLKPNQTPDQVYHQAANANNLDDFDIQDLIAKQINLFEIFLLHLKEKGSTVPVLFNCRTSMYVNDKARLIKIYNHLQFTNDYFEIKNFTSLLPLDYKNIGQGKETKKSPGGQKQIKKQKNKLLFDEDEEDDFYENEITESENFDQYYNEMESEMTDVNIEEEDTYNEETILNHEQNTQNNLRYSFID